MDVIQLGGITRSSSVSVVGPFAEQMLRSFNCSKLFIGVDGIDPDFGLTTTNMLEASLNRAMIDAAQKVVVLADSSKFGRRGFSKICDLESVDRIITDNPGAAALPRPAARAGDRGDGGGGLRSRRGTSRFRSRGYAPPGGRECGTGGRNSAARSVSSFRESYSLSRACRRSG